MFTEHLGPFTNPIKENAAKGTWEIYSGIVEAIQLNDINAESTRGKESYLNILQ